MQQIVIKGFGNFSTIMVNRVDVELLQKAKQRAELCGVFGNSKRVLIMWALTDRELSVSEIADFIGASMQNTSQHLRILKDHEMLHSRREGQTIFYSVDENRLLQSCRRILLRKGGTANL